MISRFNEYIPPEPNFAGEVEPDLHVDATVEGVIASHVPEELLTPPWDGERHHGREHGIKTLDCTDHQPQEEIHLRPMNMSRIFRDYLE